MPLNKLNKWLAGDFREQVKVVCFAIQDKVPEWLETFLSDDTRHGNVILFPEVNQTIQYQSAYMLKFLAGEDKRRQEVEELAQKFPRYKGRTPDPRTYIVTRSPWIVSDFDRLAVFVVGESTIDPPEFQTFGASANKINMCIFDHRNTCGGVAKGMMDAIYARVQMINDPDALDKIIDDEIAHVLGDSVEKTLLMNTILDKIDTLKGADHET